MNEWELTDMEKVETANDALVGLYTLDKVAHEAQKKLMKYIFDNMRVNELDGEAWKKLCIAFIEEE